MNDDDPIPISLVVHQAFCPRRAWLETMGEHTDTAQVATGTVDHDATDDTVTSRSARLRGVDVRSDRLGICGRCDTLEVGDNGSLTVVEYKSTPVRRKASVMPSTRAELALQGIALTEMGHKVAGHAVHFTQHRTRVDVSLTREDAVTGRSRHTPAPPFIEALKP